MDESVEFWSLTVVICMFWLAEFVVGIDGGTAMRRLPNYENRIGRFCAQCMLLWINSFRDYSLRSSMMRLMSFLFRVSQSFYNCYSAHQSHFFSRLQQRCEQILIGNSLTCPAWYTPVQTFMDSDGAYGLDNISMGILTVGVIGQFVLELWALVVETWYR